MTVWFNRRYVENLTKEQFIKEFKDVYPELNLGNEYDKIVPPKIKDYKAKEKPEKED